MDNILIESLRFTGRTRIPKRLELGVIVRNCNAKRWVKPGRRFKLNETNSYVEVPSRNDLKSAVCSPWRADQLRSTKVSQQSRPTGFSKLVLSRRFGENMRMISVVHVAIHASQFP